MWQVLQLSSRLKFRWQLNQINLTNNIERNKKVGFYISVSIHALMALVFFVLLAWTAPDPPIPEYGIEFSMAIGAESAAKRSPMEEEEVVPLNEEASEEMHEVLPLEAPKEQEVESSDEVEPEPIETIDEISPDIVEEAKPTISESIQEDIKEVEVEQIEPEQKEEVEASEENIESEEVKKVDPVIEDRAIMKGSDVDGESEKGTSQGSSLNLSGWDWDFKPTPNDTSEENGKIVFQITVDDEGEILKIITIEKTVSPVVEKIYKEAVMDLTFSKTADNRSAAISSVGKITFIIQSK